MAYYYRAKTYEEIGNKNEAIPDYKKIEAAGRDSIGASILRGRDDLLR